MNIDIAKFDRCRIVVLGDLMIDEYVWGVVDRISPEAPVQIVSVRSEELTLGGAGNVVNNLVALGAQVAVVGVIGDGEDGKLLRRKFEGLGVDARGIIPEAGRPTTRKTRIIAAHQQVLRIDRETQREIARQTFQAMTKALKEIVPTVDVVLISDYGKGVISR
ncbi:MAG: hypothetical protein JSW39_17200, partial [Desulfobacterales bacterium]